MANLTQQQFLGLSISKFSASVGWNGQGGSLDLTLVEDAKNSDQFANAVIGSPVYFSYDNFNFGGILQHYNIERSDAGNPLFNVTVIDPTELIDNVQLILGGYNGTIGNIANIVNVYGYLEDLNGFGASQRNDGGMPYHIARTAIVQLLAAVTPITGVYSRGRIYFRGYSYVIDFSELPPMNINYRIGPSIMSLLEFVQTVCADAGHDFFFRLEHDTNFGGGGNTENVIKLKTVSRVAQPPLGQINTFINSQSQVNSLASGLELRNDVTTNFLVGGAKQRLWQIGSNDISGMPPGAGTNFPSGEEAATIWPFWGVDINGNAVLGRGNFYDIGHSFTIDARQMYVIGIGDTYSTDVGEIRTALYSKEEWESYIETFQPQKAAQIGLNGPYRATQEMLEALRHVGPQDPRFFIQQTRKYATAMANRFTTDQLDASIQRLYEYIRSFAEEYYGRKFMVKVPDILISQIPETLEIQYSQEPSDGGWPEETDPGIGLPNAQVELFRHEDGRIMPMILHPVVSGLVDLTAWSQQDFLVNNSVLYSKVEIDPNIYFLDAANGLEPRVVITLPATLDVPEESPFLTQMGLVAEQMKIV